MDVQTSVYTESASSSPISTNTTSSTTPRDVNMISANNSNQFSPLQAPQTNLSANSYRQRQISRTHQQPQHSNQTTFQFNHANLPNLKQNPPTQLHHSQYTIAPPQPSHCFGIANHNLALSAANNNNFLSNNIPGQFVTMSGTQSVAQCTAMSGHSLNSYGAGIASLSRGNSTNLVGSGISVNPNNGFPSLNAPVNNSNNSSVNHYGTNIGNQNGPNGNLIVGGAPANNSFSGMTTNINNNNNHLVSSSQPSISTRYPAKIHYKLNRSSPTNPGGGGGSGSQTANNSPNTSNVSSPIGSDQCSPLVSPSSANNVNNHNENSLYDIHEEENDDSAMISDEEREDQNTTTQTGAPSNQAVRDQVAASLASGSFANNIINNNNNRPASSNNIDDEKWEGNSAELGNHKREQIEPSGDNRGTDSMTFISKSDVRSQNGAWASNGQQNEPVDSASNLGLSSDRMSIDSAIISHFNKGSIIELSNKSLKRIENITTEDLLQSSGSNCLTFAKVSNIRTSTTASEEGSANETSLNNEISNTTKVEITLESDGVSLTTTASIEQPFISQNEGWVSLAPNLTSELYGLTCERIQHGSMLLIGFTSPSCDTKSDPQVFRSVGTSQVNGPIGNRTVLDSMGSGNCSEGTVRNGGVSITGLGQNAENHQHDANGDIASHSGFLSYNGNSSNGTSRYDPMSSAVAAGGPRSAFTPIPMSPSRQGTTRKRTLGYDTSLAGETPGVPKTPVLQRSADD